MYVIHDDSAVEIKSFVGVSTISEFHTALGQYWEYIVALEDDYPEYPLHLAVPVETYRAFFAL